MHIFVNSNRLCFVLFINQKEINRNDDYFNIRVNSHQSQDSENSIHNRLLYLVYLIHSGRTFLRFKIVCVAKVPKHKFFEKLVLFTLFLGLTMGETVLLLVNTFTSPFLYISQIQQRDVIMLKQLHYSSLITLHKLFLHTNLFPVILTQCNK